MHLIEHDDDFQPKVSFKRNGSLTCAILPPLLLIDGLSRKSFSYNKLPQEPLKLTVLKLDGTSFCIQVAKMATVAELKQAVEDSFSHLPTKGPGMVSWPHVWGNFCLCYDGQKLLMNHDYLRSYRIKDGDQLHFIRHASINYNLVKTRKGKVVPEVERGTISETSEEREQHGEDDYICHDQEKLKHLPNDYMLGKYNIKQCEFKMAFLLKGVFSYRRLTTSSEMSFEQKSSRKSKSTNGFFKKMVRLCNRTHNPRKKTIKVR
ncbi:hypothetical protein LguiB_012155 [Lonicera macranthoides]